MAVLALAAVAVAQAWDRAPAEKHACVVLVDRSDSVGTPISTSLTISNLRAALEWCRERKAATHFRYFADDALVSQPPGISVDYGAKHRSGTAAEDEHLRVFSLASDALGIPVESDFTDYFGALVIAQREFAARGERKRHLFVLGDGLSTQDPNLGDLSDAESITAKLKELRAKRLLPDFTGVDLYFAGVGGGTQAGSNALQGALDQFWTAYETATGATRRSYTESLVLP